MEAPRPPEQAAPTAQIAPPPSGIGAWALRGQSLAVSVVDRASNADAQALPFKLLLVRQGRSEVSQAGRRAGLAAG